MPRATVQFLLWANRLLPRPALPGDRDPLEYARWEYHTSSTLIDLWRRCGGRRPQVALDLGCGLGGKTHRLAEEDPVQWFALDLSMDHLLGAAAYHAADGAPPILKLAGDAARLPFADASLDRIITSDTLEHFPRPLEVLRELRRCIHPEGRVILLFTPWGSPRGSHLGDMLHLPWCQLFFDRESLKEAALAAAERQAVASTDPQDAQRLREFGQDLVEHFDQHVHPTKITQFRSWIADTADFEIEHDLHLGAGPFGQAAWLSWPLFEEWMTANFGVILRPR